MKDYNLLCVFNGALDDEKTNNALDKVKEYIAQATGEVKSAEPMGRKPLATPFHKHKNMATGNYITVNIKLAADKVNDLRWNLKHFEPLVRFMVIAVVEKRDKHKEEMVTA